MTARLRILGCGSSGGVPRIGGNWGVCDPENPKNRRLRSSVLIEKKSAQGAATSILVDTSPDLRQQLLDAGTGHLDAVLYTHNHADHTHGIDDLRVICYNSHCRIDTYATSETYDLLKTRFEYCFVTPEGSEYPPILIPHLIEPGEGITIEGEGGAIDVQPFEQQHGTSRSLGFRFGSLAYSTDVNGLSDKTLSGLQGLDVWIVDALRYTTHPSHFSVDEALAMIERVNPRRAVLTHLHVDLDYDTLMAALPDRVEPAYDGMVIEFDP